MKLVEINPIEFNRFAKAEPNSTFYQTTNWANFYSFQDYTPIYLGYCNDDSFYEALGLFLINNKSSFLNKEVICPYGFLTNFHDENIVEGFTSAIKKYFSKKGIRKIIINPNIQNTTTKTNNNLLINKLEKLGYKKTKDSFYYLITKNNKKTKVNNIVCLNTYVIKNEEEINRISKNNPNYLRLYKTMGNTVHFIVCELDVEKSIAKINKEIDLARSYIDAHKKEKKYAEKILSKKDDISNRLNILLMLNDYYKNINLFPVLALSCIVTHKKTITRLFSEETNDYKKLLNKDVILDMIYEYMDEKGYNELVSYSYVEGCQKINLIGELTYKIR